MDSCTSTQFIWILLLSPFVVYCTRDFDRETCKTPPNTGRCRAAMPMWFFNATTNVCEEFIWGGCPGNNNMFPNREVCIRNCHPETCALTAEVGTCRANIRLWFFDVNHRQCSEFYYGGCGGNENKFGSQETCEAACAGTNLLCELADKFTTIGYKSVHQDYREKEWFTYSCDTRCKERCLDDHPWGACLSFSTRRRWYRCECYLFDRYVSELEFDQDTKGKTGTRQCDE